MLKYFICFVHCFLIQACSSIFFIELPIICFSYPLSISCIRHATPQNNLLHPPKLKPPSINHQQVINALFSATHPKLLKRIPHFYFKLTAFINIIINKKYRQMIPETESMFKKKREENSVSIRRSMREDKFTKRRNLKESMMNSEENEKEYCPNHEGEIIDLREQLELRKLYECVAAKNIENELKMDAVMEDLVQIMAASNINELSIDKLRYLHEKMYSLRLRLNSSQAASTLLSQKLLLQTITSLLFINQLPQLQYEVLFIFVNITYYSPYQQYQSVIQELDLIKPIFSLLSSQHQIIREECIGVVGNLACDDAQLRDLLIENGVITSLISLIQQGKDVDQSAWALSNFCRGTPPPSIQKIALAISAIIKLLSNSVIRDASTLGDCLKAISVNINSSLYFVEQLISGGIIRRLGSLMRHKSLHVIIPAIQIAETISEGSSNQISRMVKEPEFLYSLGELMKNTKQDIRIRACLILQNVLIYEKVIKLVLENKALMGMLEYILKEGDIKMKRQIYAILGNIAAGADSDLPFLEYLQSINFVQNCIEDLKIDDINLSKSILNNLMDILQFQSLRQEEQGEETVILAQLLSHGFGNILQLYENSLDEELGEIVEEFNMKFCD